jgi:CPA2 family monovalent cation:H+ antiporter-2
MTGFLLLAFILLVAGVVAVPIAARLGLGSVLGYLLAGMALSPLLGFLGVDVVALQHFAEFGVVMMLFLIGLDLEPKRLWAMRKRLMGLGGGQVVITTLVIAGISLVSGYEWRTAFAIGMILALSSTAIVLQTLEEKGWLKRAGGEASFSVLLVQDVAVILMLALLPLLALPELATETVAGAGDDTYSEMSLVAGLPAWLNGLVTVGSIGLVVFVGSYLSRPIFRYVASADLRELFTAIALLFVVGIALLMVLVGLSPALGAFIAGVVLANSEYRHELEADISPFKGLLLGLFFITVGAGIDFALAVDQFGSVLFWTSVLIVTKMAILFAIGKFFDLKDQDRWLFTLGLAQAGEFGFVLIAFALSNAVLPAETASLLLLVVAFSMLVTPLLFIIYDKLIAPRYSKSDDREQDTIDEQNQIIIAGRGRMGGIVDRMLQSADFSTTVIDYDSKHLDIVRKFGVRTYFGDATRPDLLRAAGIDDAKLLIVALDDRESIDRLVTYAAANFPNLHIISRALDRNHVFELWYMGCRDIIRETYDSSLRMGRSAFEALGVDRQQAQALSDTWEEMDRRSLREVADYYDMEIPYHENEPLMAKIKELRAEWDPVLRDQMDEILKRGR